MKKILSLLLIATIFSFNQTQAQIRKIPAAVTSAFGNKFPAASDISWGDNLTNFEASYTLDNHQQSSSFNKKGTWKKTEKIIAAEELPKAINDGFAKSKYTDWEQKAFVEITTPDAHEYRILVKKNDLQKKNIYFF